MSTEMQIALVGVIGTLSGTFLGWLLNKFSQRGKLNIYISSFKDSFEHNQTGYMVPSSSVEQAKLYKYRIVMDLYNSSGEVKILRNFSIVFNDGEKDLHISVPYDDSTRRNAGPGWTYDKLEPLNIPPKTVVQLSLHNSFWLDKEDADFIWKTQKVYLTYTDENNRRKKQHIKHEEYIRYFENHTSEEKHNGET